MNRFATKILSTDFHGFRDYSTMMNSAAWRRASGEGGDGSGAGVLPDTLEVSFNTVGRSAAAVARRPPLLGLDNQFVREDSYYRKNQRRKSVNGKSEWSRKGGRGWKTMRKKKLKSLFSGEENNDETNEGEKENGNMNKKQKKKNKHESETSLSSSTM